ncbi:MAG TPA: MgtC/SapB family protein [Xanthomonadales bacterium]|nr:MgtC/SapB family protein [Xanthomonadales bacterium]
MDLPEINWSIITYHLTLMGVAYLLALPVGWNREKYERSAGLRTFPLVAVATCGFMLVGMESLSSSEAHARVLSGIITGMGFLGGGAILKSKREVTGTATAVSLWATGAMGIAVAWQRFEIAIVISVLTFLTLQFFHELKEKVSDNPVGDADREDED